jgi:serine/threonine protein phosphatase PrpC
VRIEVGISQDIGLREKMEDEHEVCHLPDKSFFGAAIYDGHGGRMASSLAAEVLTPHFLRALDEELQKPSEARRPISELVRDAYKAADEFILYKGTASGTTVATFYIAADHFIAANAGDTRVVIGTRNGVEALTVDHKPDLPVEQARIEALGGTVITFDVPRVQGVLSTSRALGDPSLKPFVSPEPRVIEGALGRENDYVVLACDGVWDVLMPEEVMRAARTAGHPQIAAESITTTALDRGSTDNITVIVLDIRAHARGLSRNSMEIEEITDYAER